MVVNHARIDLPNLSLFSCWDDGQFGVTGLSGNYWLYALQGKAEHVLPVPSFRRFLGVLTG
jgi:hypothetical protein